MEQYKNKRVLVTGGAGFIGSHVAQQLVGYGADVTILDNLSTGSRDNIVEFKRDVSFIEGSITNLHTCLWATRDIDYVFHLAAFVSVPQSKIEPEVCNEINVTGTRNMLEASLQNNVTKFVFSSSSAVYGNQQGICDEQSACNPTSPYGQSKLMGELLCEQYTHDSNLSTVMLRYFNVYGPRQNPHGSYAGVVAQFKHAMEHNKPIIIYGDGMQTRDFIPVEDVAKANIHLAITSTQKSDVFNIGTGTSITLLQLIDMLKQEHPQYSEQVRFAPARTVDIKHSQADCSKFLKLCNLF
jgi:nucleoside-diphosphate-sugar epimerase